jgi:hypothetical protein
MQHDPRASNSKSTPQSESVLLRVKKHTNMRAYPSRRLIGFDCLLSTLEGLFLFKQRHSTWAHLMGENLGRFE